MVKSLRRPSKVVFEGLILQTYAAIKFVNAATTEKPKNFPSLRLFLYNSWTTSTPKSVRAAVRKLWKVADLTRCRLIKRWSCSIRLLRYLERWWPFYPTDCPWSTAEWPSMLPDIDQLPNRSDDHRSLERALISDKRREYRDAFVVQSLGSCHGYQ